MSRAVWLSGFVALNTIAGPLTVPPRTTVLTWDTVPDVAGYRLYVGTASRNYSSTLEAGNTNVISVSNLTNGTQYYFAVTAYDTNGIESDFSDEIAYTPGGPVLTNTPPTLSLNVSPDDQVLLSGTGGGANHQFEIQASSNFVSWSSVGTATADGSGHFSVSLGQKESVPVVFYRVRDVSP